MAVSNEQSAESRSLFPVVHGQPTEEDGGHRVRRVAANSPGKHCVLDGYCGQRVVGDDLDVCAVDADEASGEVADMVREGTVDEVLIERRLAAIEASGGVRSFDGAGASQRHSTSHGAWCANRSTSSGMR